MEVKENIDEPVKPLVLLLVKNPTDVEIDNFLKSATNKIISEKPTHIYVRIDAWSTDCRHPAMIPGAKRIYEHACERGLLGMLAINGYPKEATEVYAVAYSKKAKLKSNNRLQIKIDTSKYEGILDKSINAYKKLMEFL